MRLPTLPGPGDVVDVVSRTSAAVDALLEAAPRLVGLVAEMEHLLRDARALVGRIEQTRVDADDVVRRSTAVVETAEATLVRVGATVEDAEGVLRRTTATVQAVDPVVSRVAELTDGLAPSLRKLEPTLERLAETTQPGEVDALVHLVDTMPTLAQRLHDVMPVLGSLDSVAPDVRELLEVGRELNLMIAKLPGMGMIKRRVEEEEQTAGA